MENKSEMTVTEQILQTVEEKMKTSFEMGMKYKRLQVMNLLVPILRQNEFDDETIAVILNDSELLEDMTYADIFAND